MQEIADPELKEVCGVELCFDVHFNKPVSLEQLENVFSTAKTGIKQSLTDLHNPQWVVMCLTCSGREQYRITIVHQAMPGVKYRVLKFRDVRFGKASRSYRSEPFEYFKEKFNDIQSRFMTVYDSGRWRSVCVRADYECEEVKSCDARQVDGVRQENTICEREWLIEPLD
jgi:hypothetical protein